MLHPTDVNGSGFSLAQADQTVTVTYTVAGSVPTRNLAVASITSVTPAIVHVGDAASVALAVGNAATGVAAERLVAGLTGASGGFSVAAAGPTAGSQPAPATARCNCWSTRPPPGWRAARPPCR